MSSSDPLAHRSLRVHSSLGRGSSSPSSIAGSNPSISASTAYTPTRTSNLTGLTSLSGTSATPSGVRAEEETIVIEVGARALRVGMAGDAVPKAIPRPTPALSRRAGDLKMWQAGWTDDWKRGRMRGSEWTSEFELFGADVRRLDVGLMEDKVEKLLRDAYRRCVCALLMLMLMFSFSLSLSILLLAQDLGPVVNLSRTNTFKIDSSLSITNPAASTSSYRPLSASTTSLVFSTCSFADSTLL